MTKYLVENKQTISMIIDALSIPGFLILSLLVINNIYKKDYTYRSLRAITKAQKLSDYIEMGTEGRKKRFLLLNRLNVFERAISEAKRKFLLLDEERKEFIALYVIFKYFVPGLMIIFALTQGGTYIIRTAIVIPVMLIGPEIYIKNKQKEHEKLFENYSYKIFKFINNQRAAGVPTQKLITKLHQTVDNQKLKRRLISFAADYIANNDYSSSFNEYIMKYYSTNDARLLDNALRQGLNVGDRYSVSEDEEQLMFDKYISYIEYETEKRKLKLVFIAALFSLVLVVLVGFPLALQVKEALLSIFNYQ
ncbi:MAG: hypothetical protein IBX70_12340 [Clostridia bacterium]|nr:hypothetical protein [Clostridia bacterium]